MALRPSFVSSLAQQAGITDSEAKTLWDMESSQGQNPAAAGNEFQVTRAAFDEVLPQGDYSREADRALAGMLYFKKYKERGGDLPAEGFLAYSGGPNARKLLDDPKLLAKHMETNSINPLEYTNKAMTKLQAFQASGSDVQSPGQMGGSDRFLPTKVDPMDVIANLHEQMLKTSSAAMAQFDQNNTAINELRAGYDANIAAVVNSITGAGEAQKTAILAKSAADAQMAAEASAQLSRLGINQSDIDNMAATLAVRMNKNKMQADQLRASIQEKDQGSFLADPITWIQNQFAMQDEITKHNQLIGNVNADAAYMLKVNAVSQALTASNTAKKALLDVNANIALADATALSARAKASEALADGKKTDLSMMQTQMLASNAKINELRAMAETLRISNDDKMKQAGLEMTRQADALSLKQAQDGLSVLGIQVNSVNDLKRLTPAQKKAFDIVVSSGGTVFGETPEEAWNNVNSGVRSKLPPTTSNLYDWVGVLAADAKKATTSPEGMLAASTKEGRDKFVSNKMYETAQKWQSDVNINPISNRNENPYRAPTVSTMIADPEIMKLKLSGLLKQTAEKNPGWEGTDNQIISLVKEDFLHGTTYTDIQEAAAEIAKYYQRAMKINNQTHNFDAWRLPKQEHYNFTSDTGRRTDWAYYADVISALSKKTFTQLLFDQVPGSVPAAEAQIP